MYDASQRRIYRGVEGITIEELQRRHLGIREFIREIHTNALDLQEQVEAEGSTLKPVFVEETAKHILLLEQGLAAIEATPGGSRVVPTITNRYGRQVCTDPDVLTDRRQSCIHRGCAACFHQEDYQDDLPPGHCRMCRGTGTRPEFHHVQEGVCFHCGGSGRHHAALPTPTGDRPHVS
jgi:hypothetical protein